MSKSLIATIAFFILLIGGGAYFVFKDTATVPPTGQMPQPKPQPAADSTGDAPQTAPTQTITTAPSVKQVITPEAAEQASAQPLPPLPELNSSDTVVIHAIKATLDQPELIKLLVDENLIRKIVATVDNLPGQKLPSKIRMLAAAPGEFKVDYQDGGPVISPENARRYHRFIALLQSVDPKQLAQLYVRFYPLFQQAYQDLGYPDGYFNDRFMTVLDHLIQTPSVLEPVALTQPGVYYKYAAPPLENRSIGQRILMRIGEANRQAVIARLKALRAEIQQYVKTEHIPEQPVVY